MRVDGALSGREGGIMSSDTERRARIRCGMDAALNRLGAQP